MGVFGKWRNIEGEAFDEQHKHMQNFLEWVAHGVVEPLFDSGLIYNPMLVSDTLSQVLFSNMVYSDTFFAIFSMMFIFVVFIAYLRSLFLAMVAIEIIVLSFPLTALLYDGVFGVKHFSQFQMLILYVVLGIGADDIFVFVDCWR